MDTYRWYAQLIKPSWAPPNWLFGPVWIVLYFIILLTFGKVFLMVWRQKIPLVVAMPFVLNLLFNVAFSPIQFQMQNNVLAAIDISFVFGTIAWMMYAIHPYSKKIAYAQIPYLCWVSFATVLQFSITYLNR